MKVTDPNTIVCSSGLASVVEDGKNIKITLKNKTTLDIIPVVDEDGKFCGFEYNYMTAQQNRKINSLKEKMSRLQSEMADIITAAPGEDDVEDVEDEELEEETEDLESEIEE